MIDWKIVFSTNMNHYVFIKHKKDSYYLDFFYTHQYEIEKEPSFFFLIPSNIELRNSTPKDYVAKFGPLLRKFIESPDKKTLFAEEDVLKALIKEEKRSIFFKFLSKNKKNIVLFCHDNLNEAARNDNYIYINYTIQDLEFHLSLFNKFSSIRTEIKKTYNPFKNPAQAYININQPIDKD